jgi:hypothetical protein
MKKSSIHLICIIRDRDDCRRTPQHKATPSQTNHSCDCCTVEYCCCCWLGKKARKRLRVSSDKLVQRSLAIIMSDQSTTAPKAAEPSPVPPPVPSPPPHGQQHGDDDVCDSNDTSKLPPWHAPCPPPRLRDTHHVVFDTGLKVKNSLTRTKVPFVTMTGTNQLTWYMYVCYSVLCAHFAGSCIYIYISATTLAPPRILNFSCHFFAHPIDVPCTCRTRDDYNHGCGFETRRFSGRECCAHFATLLLLGVVLPCTLPVTWDTPGRI